MNSDTSGPDFDQEYFDRHCGPVPHARQNGVWQSAFEKASRHLIASLNPKTALDVGCGMGFLVEQLRDQGVDAHGIDVSEYALENVREDMRSFCRSASALDPIEGSYDVITSLGVAETLDAGAAERVVRNLCAHTEEILFSPGAGDHDNPYALNIRDASYWNELFALNDFYPVLRGGPDYFPGPVTHYRKLVRKIKVAVFSREREDWAVIRLRLLDPLAELEKSGRVAVTVVSRYDESIPVEEVLNADIWVIHREFADHEYSEGLLKAARLMGKVVVFEIDDLVTQLPRSHAMYDYCTRVTPDVLGAAREADFVTGTTERLLIDLAKDEPSILDKAHVLKNVVNTDIWGASFFERPQFSGDPFIVGWSGSMTHDDDLALVGDAIRYLSRKHREGIEFHFHGYVPQALKDIPGVKLMRGPTVDYHHHIQTIRDAPMHLALAPLTDHPFNQAKSDLKWIEYSIASVPAVFSKVAAYTNSVIDGVNGFLVENNTQAWIDAIERAMTDESLRRRVASEAFREVKARRTVEASAEQWDRTYRAFVATGPRFTELCDVSASADDSMRRAAGLLFRTQARHLLRASKWLRATVSLEAALELDNTLAESVTQIADEVVEAGQFAVGAQILESVIERDPSNIPAFLRLCRLHLDQGDEATALTVLRRAEELHGSNTTLAAVHLNLLHAVSDEQGVSDRLRLLIEGEFTSEEAVEVAEICVRFGRPSHALELIDRAAAADPATDFEPLQQALHGCSVPLPDRDADRDLLKVAVYTRTPLSSFAYEQRLGAPLRVLGMVGIAKVRTSDGLRQRDIVDWADVVIMHGDIVSRAGDAPVVERIVDRARLLGKPVVYEVDDLPFERMALRGDDGALAMREDVVWMIEEADATTVPTDGLAAIYRQLAPTAAERIHVLATQIDPQRFDSSMVWYEDDHAPLQIGVFTDWARPSDVAALIRAMSPVLSSSKRKVEIKMWSARTEPGATLPTDSVIGSASPFYGEYIRRLRASRIDLALVPVSPDIYYTTLADSVWAELAACRTPAIFSAREPFASSVDNGATGLLMGDRFEDWAEVIQKTVECPEIRRMMAENAWCVSCAERLIHTTAAQWAELYRSLSTAAKQQFLSAKSSAVTGEMSAES